MSKFTVFALMIAAILLIASCGGDGSEASKQNSKKTTKVEPKPKSNAGAKLYKTYCIACHGPNGDMAINGAKDLKETLLTLDEKVEMIKNGKGLMTPFESILSEKQIQQVAEFTETLKN